ncbi:MAG: hypothetical protein ALAOOOJD_01190 [bacterium]|nr:hypothetical protein [bacterium]
MDRRQTISERHRVGFDGKLLLQFRRAGGNEFRHQAHGLIDQQAVRFAALIMQNFAAGWVGRGWRDAGQRERLRIDHGHVAIGAIEVNRQIRHDAIQLIAGWESFFRPIFLHPAPTGDPVPDLLAQRPILNAHKKFLKGFAAVEIQIKRALADALIVIMAVDEAGHDGFAAEINHVGLCGYPALGFKV